MRFFLRPLMSSFHSCGLWSDESRRLELKPGNLGGRRKQIVPGHTNILDRRSSLCTRFPTTVSTSMAPKAAIEGLDDDFSGYEPKYFPVASSFVRDSNLRIRRRLA